MRGRERALRHSAPRTRARSRALACGTLLCAALAAGGCGGGARQDAREAARSYDLQVVRASFPARQSIAHRTTLELLVRNTGARTVPNVAVALDSLSYVEKYPDLAANKRPVWAIEQGPGPHARPPVESQEVSDPGGGQTAYVNTWALGPLPPGRTQIFRWRLMPVKAGAHTVDYAVFPGLAGRARARLRSGVPPAGRFSVYVAPAPEITHVEPNSGRIAPGPYPVAP